MSIKAFKKGLPAFKKLSDHLLADNSALDPLTGHAEIYCDPFVAPTFDGDQGGGYIGAATPIVCPKGEFANPHFL